MLKQGMKQDFSLHNTRRVGVTGATGFVGQAVVAVLREAGYDVVGFSRNPAQPIPGCVETRQFAPPEPPDGRDLGAVIHLAGENILGRWTPAKKERILRSRVEGTTAVARAVADGGFGGVLLSASAVGYFGNTGEEEKTENSPAGSGFLAEVSLAWEAALAPARRANEQNPQNGSGKGMRTRVAHVRLGMVLGREGGAMRLLRPLFLAGLGGRLGSGSQWMSPVHVRDVAGIFLHLLETPDAEGPFHAVLPEPVRNREFTRALGRAVRRPAPWPVPAWALRMVLGDLSHLLLDSSRIRPQRTLHSGYKFVFPTLGAIFQEITS